MTNQLIECVPNFSEGRKQPVIDRIVDAIASVQDVLVLDVSSDVDHNRTVVTFAAPPGSVGEAAFRGIATAAEYIDLEQHNGVHPRIGAADVVPFVPLRDVAMDDCINIARQVGARVGNELKLPVYLYESAVLRPERRNLAYIRKHQYETLKSKIAHDPEFTPDYGPSQIGSAGAVAIGVRKPLIAFNIYLDAEDVTTAKTIARKIRESNGGLPGVKALGLLVGGRAQVSINLVDATLTSLYTVFDAVRREATAAHTSIHHSELIGLIPQAVLIESALQALQLPISVSEYTLEKRLGLLTNDYREINL